MLSYEAAIIRELRKLGSGETKNPDAKHNVGNMLGDFFLWKTVSKFAEAQMETAFKKLEANGLFKVPTEPGNYELVNSPRFVLNVNVTQPVKRFSADELAALMFKSKYKVPEPFTKSQVEAAKVPGNSMVRKEVKEVA